MLVGMSLGIPVGDILFAIFGLRGQLDVGDEEDDDGCEVCDGDGDGGV